jgi:hypothetical protein
LTIPPNTLGVGDQLRIEPVFSWTNSANAKTLAVKVGPALGSAVTLYARSRTNNLLEAPLVVAVVRSAAGANGTLLPYVNTGGYGVNQSGGVGLVTLDWTIANSVFVTGALAVAGETLTLETVRVSRG